jgi:hypothetical protein
MNEQRAGLSLRHTEYIRAIYDTYILEQVLQNRGVDTKTSTEQECDIVSSVIRDENWLLLFVELFKLFITAGLL